mgnify:CR=1 FL=1
MAKLGEVCKVSPSTKNIKRQSAWLLNLDMVEQQTGRVIEYKYAGEDDLNGSIIQFDTENVLYSKLRPNLNKVVLPEKDGFSTSELLPLRPDASVLNRDYLAVFLRSDSFVTWAVSKTAGAKMPRLGTKDLMNAEIPVPNIERQKEIAEKFKKLEQLISLRKQQLAKLDELVKARFVEMFGNPIENTMNWPKKLLRDITTKIGSGATPKGGRESYPNAGVSLIRSMNVYDGQFLYKDLAHLTDEQATQLNGVTVEAEDVLVNITGASVARSCVVPKDVLPARVNQHVAIVRCNRELLNPIFTNKMFINNEFKKELLSIGESGGATRQAITKKQLEELSVVVPPLSIQNEFFTFSECVDQQKQTVQQSLDKLELMKKALMQEYFG